MTHSFNVKAGYDYRFGTVSFQTQGLFYFNLKEFIKQLNIDPDEFAAVMSEEYQWTEGTEDIDGARVRMLEETDWKDRVALDIGGYDGFAAEIALKRGAKRAICLDNHQYEHYQWADVRKEGVEYVQGDFMDWKTINSDNRQDVIIVGRNDDFLPRPDTIIYFNVQYHLKNQWAALEKVRELLKPDGEMLLCSLIRYGTKPTFYLYEPRECNSSDSTVFWGPTLSGLERLLTLTGWTFEKYAFSHDRVLYRCKPIPDFVPDLAEEGYAKS